MTLEGPKALTTGRADSTAMPLRGLSPPALRPARPA